MKYHRLSIWTEMFTVLEAGKSKEFLAEFGFSWGFSCWLVYNHLLDVHSYGLSLVYAHGERALVSLLVIRTLILSDQVPTFMISFNLSYFWKGPISKYSHIGDSTWNLGECNSVHSVHQGRSPCITSIMQSASLHLLPAWRLGSRGRK